MDNLITWRRCDRCGGAGKVQSIIEEGRRYNCSVCGGHGQLPDGGDGCAWFIRVCRRGRGDHHVAVLQNALGEGGGWRVTKYDKAGPLYHMEGSAAQAMDDLNDYAPSAVAARWLDFWSTRAEWKRGIKSHHYLAFWNLFSFRGRYDLCRQIDAEHSAAGIDAAIAMAGKLKAQHLPDDTLY